MASWVSGVWEQVQNWCHGNLASWMVAALRNLSVALTSQWLSLKRGRPTPGKGKRRGGCGCVAAVMKCGCVAAVMECGCVAAVMKCGCVAAVMECGCVAAVMECGCVAAVMKCGCVAAVMKCGCVAAVMKCGCVAAVMKCGCVACCRGKGDNHRLGHDSAHSVATPVMIKGLFSEKIVQISAGTLNCLALSAKGEVRLEGHIHCVLLACHLAALLSPPALRSGPGAAMTFTSRGPLGQAWLCVFQHG